MKQIVWDNLKFFLERLKAMKISKNINLKNDDEFCVSTGCESASENWVYFPEIIKKNDDILVNKILKFFNELKLPFIWPIYDENSDGIKILEKSGLINSGNLMAMLLDTKKLKNDFNLKNIKFEKSDSIDFSRRWSKTVWHGFGGEYEDVPESFFKLSESMTNDKKNLLQVIAKFEDKDVGTFLITLSGENVGVYYFAVIPEYRRMGIANLMMNEICKYGEKIILQATPSGVPFYKKFGFESLFEIPVYSNSDDVF